MDRKNMALILSIFLFVGLLFSVDCLEWQQGWNYDEQNQVYNASTGAAVHLSMEKSAKRAVPLMMGVLFFICGMLYGRRERWVRLYFKRIEMLYFLKQVRVSQRMDGKKRKSAICVIG